MAIARKKLDTLQVPISTLEQGQQEMDKILASITLPEPIPMYNKWSRANFDVSQLAINFSHIERRAKLSMEEFVLNYDAVHRPVLLTDAISEWKAMQKWSLDQLVAGT